MSIEAMKQALEALENPWKAKPEGVANAITALRQAIEQAQSVANQQLTTEQEPVAWVWVNNKGWLTYGETPHDMVKSSPLYAFPPQRQWVGLTDEEEFELDEKYGDDFNVYIDQRDLKLKEKNT